MFTKYDELDLLELFLCEPVGINGSIETGEIKYTKQEQNGFELTLNMYVYELKCAIYLTYNGKDVFNTELKGITKITKTDQILNIESEDKQVVRIFFGEYFRITTY